jgi:hypothetical protein
MAAEQFSVPLGAGRVEVEVRDLRDGWVERVAVGDVEDVPEERIATSPDPEPDAEFWRARVGASGGTTLERAAAIRTWACRQTVGRLNEETGPEMREQRKARRDRSPLASADGRLVFEDVESGGGVNCLSAAVVFYDAARASGLRARRCELHVRGLDPFEAHSTVEVWWDEDEKWVVMDPTFDCSFEIDGRPASAIDLREAVRTRSTSRVRVVRAANAAGPDPYGYFLNPLLYYGNVSVGLGNGIYLERVDTGSPPPPASRRDVVACRTDEAFRDREPPAAALSIRRASVDERLAWQVFDDRLWVSVPSEHFEPGRFELRVVGGAPAFAAARPSFDPDDPFLFAPEELCGNATLRDGDSDGAPEDWRVSGSSSLERVRDGLRIEAVSGVCELVYEAPVERRTPFVAFARIAVERGVVRFEANARDEADALTVGPGAAKVQSSRIMLAKTGGATIRLTLAPGTRCVVERVSVRPSRRLGEH